MVNLQLRLKREEKNPGIEVTEVSKLHRVEFYFSSEAWKENDQWYLVQLLQQQRQYEYPRAYVFIFSFFKNFLAGKPFFNSHT